MGGRAMKGRDIAQPGTRRVERRAHPRTPDDYWRTALTCIEPNKILVRGFPLDEMMGRLTFGEAIYLLLMGEVPSPGIGSLMEAMLVSFIDHGATPPSTLAARNTATTGAPLRACVAAGVLGFGRYHGGDIESCGDHRIAMSFAIAGLVSERAISIADTGPVATSFPGFVDTAGGAGLRIGVTSS